MSGTQEALREINTQVQKPELGNPSAILRDAPVFKECSRLELSRILPLVENRLIAAGEILALRGEPADTLYMINCGEVRLDYENGIETLVKHGFAGEESVLGLGSYTADITANSPCTVMCIPRDALSAILKNNSSVANAFLNSYVSHQNSSEPENISKEMPIDAVSVLDDKGGQPRQTIGWLLAIAVPIATYALSMGPLGWSSSLFLTVFSSVIIMWIFRLTAEFVPCILMMLVILVLGIAPPSVALSGFTSGSFFMALSIFALGTVLVLSGISYRLVLLIIRLIPPSKLSYELSMLVTGVILTPIIPSSNGRVAIIEPLVTDILDVVKYKPGSRSALSLVSAAFTGVTALATVFISSKSVNFLVFGLLPQQVRDQFTWGFWALAASISGLVMLILYLPITRLIFKDKETPDPTRVHVDEQLKMLGSLKFNERVALISTIILLVGMLTSSLHKIQAPWISLGILYIVLSLGVLSNDKFKKEIDWSFLIYLGGLIGIVDTMSYLGLDALIADKFRWMGIYMKENLPLFILLLTGVICLIRLVIPNNAAVAMFCTIFLPMASANGVNPWVIGFIILTISDGWFFPYQCSYYLQLKDSLNRKGRFDEKPLLTANMWINVLRFVGIYASIPFWKMIGIL